MFDSPLDPDYPYAAYRVACPACGQHLWASDEPPPVQGEEIIDAHDCPGRDSQLDVTPTDPETAPGSELAPRAAAAEDSGEPAPPPEPPDAPKPVPAPPPAPERSPKH